MNFEVSKTLTEELFGGILCNLHYTQEFEDYCNEIDFESMDVQSFDDSIFDSMEVFIKEMRMKVKIGPEINVTAFLSEENSYVYIDATDSSYILAVLPVGNNYKYKACIVEKVY